MTRTRTALSAALAAALALLAAPAIAQTVPDNVTLEVPRWSFAIHGGAGVIERANLSPEQDAAYRAALTRALEAGSAVLAGGGSALDAIETAIRLMEDDPLFNAGRGAVFTAAGRNELDAAVMDGTNLKAGAVAGLTTTRHPIAAARAVMEQSSHVMLIGEGADTFSASVGLEQVDPAFFFTERRWQGLERALREKGLPIPARPTGAPGPQASADTPAPPLNERKFGTVGAVALDSRGQLAAGTSTGGMTGKQWGRVGDVPVIGAGTYASSAEGCAVSATGDGEYFIRATVARDICTRMATTYADHAENGAVRAVAFQQRADAEATQGVMLNARQFSPGYAEAEAELAQVAQLGGSGGVIVMNRQGRASLVMNTSGMYRGTVSSDRPAAVAIYADEDVSPMDNGDRP